MDVKEPISLAERFARKAASPAAGLTPPSPPPMEESDDVGGYRAFKIGGDHRFEVMLTLRLRTGNMRAYGYSYLVRVDFDPSKGIDLEFSGGGTITLAGRNLMPLFKALAFHKVAWICEADPLSEPAEDAATVVNAIGFGEA